MNLHNYYWYFKSALTPRFCDEVIQYANTRKLTMARTGNYSNKEHLNKEEIYDLQKKRSSDVVFLDEPWITKEVLPYVDKANRNAGWNFDLEGSENFQFTQYKLGQHYDWHCDSWEKAYENNMIRKLSATCQLTDGSEYTGGELEFDFRNYDPHMRDELTHVEQCKEILPKGSIIVFPSFMWHRVKPVTSGTRYSLVVWNLGAPFK